MDTHRQPATFASRDKVDMSGFLGGLILGAIVGAVAALVYMNNALKQQIRIQQEGEMVEYDELARKAYISPFPNVGMWALSNYLDKVEDVYSVRPAKDRQYYYMSFKGHARLARLAHDSHETNLEGVHTTLALEALKKWSVEKAPGTNFVFKSLEKIDQMERGGSSGRTNQP